MSAEPVEPVSPEPPAVERRPRPRPRQYLLAFCLFALTLFTTTSLGAGWYLSTRTDITTDLWLVLAPRTVAAVWSDLGLLATGLSFSLPVLVILLCHELGHYLACRYYGLPATPPYFIPAPIGLGTLGAFIRIRAPIRDRSQLLDIGAAGPLAGFAALVPFLVFGVAQSRPASIRLAIEEPSPLLLVVPGKCLATEIVTRLLHGPLASDQVLDLHPFALAAWVGLLATSLNLLPLGQLDGGHVLYAACGGCHRRLAVALLVLLAVAGLYWRGWLIWCLVVLIMGLRHPRLVGESSRLSRRRLAVALLCLALFVISFMPIPIRLLSISG